jgi:hypothetical protein
MSMTVSLHPDEFLIIIPFVFVSVSVQSGLLEEIDIRRLDRVIRLFCGETSARDRSAGFLDGPRKAPGICHFGSLDSEKWHNPPDGAVRNSQASLGGNLPSSKFSTPPNIDLETTILL